MTSAIFEEVLRGWDRKLNRKILLLIDNCSAHPQIKNLQNIQLEFLPPNATSVLQPMDQGIIRSLKSHYRKLLVKRLVQDLEEKKRSTISLLNAVNYIHKAWSLVETKTIKNCFQHAKWRQEDFDEDDDLPLAEWINIQTDEISDSEDNAFLNFDENIATYASLTDEEIIEEVYNENKNNSDSEKEEEEEDDEEILINVPNIQNVEQSLKTVRGFLLMGVSTPHHDALFNNLAYLESAIDKIKILHYRNQTKITDLFHYNISCMCI
jgi:hypothetical protein